MTAEVFARAFRDRGRLDGRGQSALPWLLGIGTNVIRMHRRSEERRLRAYGRAAERGRVGLPTDEIEDRVDAEAVGAVLSEALAAMPLRQRDVLLLLFTGGVSDDGEAVTGVVGSSGADAGP